MAITTDASIAQAKTTLLAQNLLTNLVGRNVLAQFLKSDTQFLGATGTYGQGATISIPVVPTVTTNIVSATGGAVTYPKQTLTNVSLTLDYIAQSSFGINEGDLALANVDPKQATIMSAARNHGFAIEKQMMLVTFNDAGIDANAVGAEGTAGNYKMLTKIWEGFMNANVPEDMMKVVILPTDIYSELLLDTTVSRILTNPTAGTLSNGVILDTLSMKLIPSNACPTSTELTNLTGTGTNKVGFAFTEDSIVGAVRRLSTGGNGLGTRQVVVANSDVNIATRFTESYNPNVVGGELQYNMETLFGTKIYRPTTVFPVFGGVA